MIKPDVSELINAYEEIVADLKDRNKELSARNSQLYRAAFAANVWIEAVLGGFQVSDTSLEPGHPILLLREALAVDRNQPHPKETSG